MNATLIYLSGVFLVAAAVVDLAGRSYGLLVLGIGLIVLGLVRAIVRAIEWDAELDEAAEQRDLPAEPA